MKKCLSVLLFAALCLSFAACGAEPTETTADTTPAADTAAETEAATETVIRDELGEYDFEGGNFTMYTRYTNMFFPSMNVEESVGEVLSDSVYDRNRGLEERFNFLFLETKYYNTVEGNDAPKKLLLAGDDSFHIMVGRYLNFFNYAAEDMLLPTTTLPNIDMSKPYWDAEMYENLSICGKHFFATGSYNLSAYDFTHVLLFNKDMAEDNALGNLYDVVNEGAWTFDRFREMCETVTVDVDGDGNMGETDRYGYTARSSAVMPAFWVGADVQPVTKNDKNELLFTALENEKFFDVCAQVYAMTWDNHSWNSSWAHLDGAAEDNKPAECFRAGNALFMDAKFFEVVALRDSDINFGILPYPKYDQAQQFYLGRMEGCELFGVPKTNAALEMTGTILEAMASESRLSVVPAYYDVMLKGKVSRDEESAAMLDLILEHLVFDAADTLLGTEFRDGTMYRSFKANQQDIASALAKSSNTYQGALDKLNTSFAALEN